MVVGNRMLTAVNIPHTKERMQYLVNQDFTKSLRLVLVIFMVVEYYHEINLSYFLPCQVCMIGKTITAKA